MANILVIGGGAWGTALAQLISNNNHNVVIYTRSKETATEINNFHTNNMFLPNILLNDKITATSSLDIIDNQDLIIVTTPAQNMRNILLNLKPYEHKFKNSTIVLCAKGIEANSNQLMHQILLEILPNTNFAILSGPNLAHEIAAGKPACTTIATKNIIDAERIGKYFQQKTFRTYYSTDIIGTEICGAAKNVLAIACGVAIALDLGSNALASLITRGVAEISRLVIASGGNESTMMSMSGIGDIMLTCTSTKSRNTNFGIEFTKNTADMTKTIEGYATVIPLLNLAQKLSVEMPITKAVLDILYLKKSIAIAIDELLSR
jgi:glycerol-3-phosphate dehydrogenase (NAD(P)+)